MLLVAFPVSSCGASGDSNEDQIRAVVAAFNDAAADADGQSMCRDVLPSEQAGSPANCARQLTQTIQHNPENWEPIEEVREITVDGDAGEATGMQAGRGDVPLRFTHESAGWRFQLFD
jgi:hypothetical protein